MTSRSRARRALLTVIATASALAAAAPVAAAPINSPDPTDQHWVGSWMAAPSDAINLADANLAPIANIANQTFRVIVTPHLGGSQVRVRLTNAERPVPLRISAATVAPAGAGARLTSTPTPLTFGGRARTTIPAGGDQLSDPVSVTIRPWQRLAVSVSVAGMAAFVTQHLNGNATSYYSLPGSGDRTASRRAGDFPLSTTVVPIVNRVDVRATKSTSAVVTLGDSITDGFVAATYVMVPQAKRVVDRNVRYPDFLQRRLDATGQQRSVVDAGISGNRTISDGFVPLLGDAAINRLQRDVLSVPGVRDVILLEGINDLGMPIGSNANQIIAGYKNIIVRLQARGLRVHLGTMLPASDALGDGYTAPFANRARQVINRWIRSQRMSDSVIDFDRAVRDRFNPSILAPRYSGPDRLHPNAAGYRRMADAIDLTAFE